MKKSIAPATALAAALMAVPMSVWADPNFCRNPADSAIISFGVGPSGRELQPNEVTITNSEEDPAHVLLDVPGSGHFVAVYPVSRNTRREDIAEDLLQADGTGCVQFGQFEFVCTASARYLVTDGSGRLILDTGRNIATDPNDFNLVNLVSGTPVPPINPTDTVRVDFFMPGRYMIMSPNRNDFIPPPYMFGFVNVVDCHAIPPTQ